MDTGTEQRELDAWIEVEMLGGKHAPRTTNPVVSARGDTLYGELLRAAEAAWSLKGYDALDRKFALYAAYASLARRAGLRIKNFDLAAMTDLGYVDRVFEGMSSVFDRMGVEEIAERMRDQ